MGLLPCDRVDFFILWFPVSEGMVYSSSLFGLNCTRGDFKKTSLSVPEKAHCWWCWDGPLVRGCVALEPSIVHYIFLLENWRASVWWSFGIQTLYLITMASDDHSCLDPYLKFCEPFFWFFDFLYRIELFPHLSGLSGYYDINSSWKGGSSCKIFLLITISGLGILQ